MMSALVRSSAMILLGTAASTSSLVAVGCAGVVPFLLRRLLLRLELEDLLLVELEASLVPRISVSLVASSVTSAFLTLMTQSCSPAEGRSTSRSSAFIFSMWLP